jgi:hypothetical protein
VTNEGGFFAVCNHQIFGSWVIIRYLDHEFEDTSLHVTYAPLFSSLSVLVFYFCLKYDWNTFVIINGRWLVLVHQVCRAYPLWGIHLAHTTNR